jgi:hypothetical protein
MYVFCLITLIALEAVSRLGRCILWLSFLIDGYEQLGGIYCSYFSKSCQGKGLVIKKTEEKEP